MTARCAHIAEQLRVMLGDRGARKALKHAKTLAKHHGSVRGNIPVSTEMVRQQVRPATTVRSVITSNVERGKHR